MGTVNTNVLDIVREGEKLLGKEIDEFFKYLYSDSFQPRLLQLKMDEGNQKKYKLHMRHKSQTLRVTHKVIEEWYTAANKWGSLMEWILKKGVSIKDSAIFALRATKLVSEPFFEYVPFVILTTFWDYGPDLIQLKDTIFDNYEKIQARRCFDNDWVNVTIREVLSRSDAEIEKVKREEKLLILLNHEKQLVRKLDSKIVLNSFEFKTPRLINSILFRIKMSIRINMYAVSEKDIYSAICAGVIMQNVLNKEEIFKEYSSLDDVFQNLLKLFTTTYKFTIPDILYKYWKYSDQLNC